MAEDPEPDRSPDATDEEERERPETADAAVEDEATSAEDESPATDDDVSSEPDPGDETSTESESPAEAPTDSPTEATTDSSSDSETDGEPDPETAEERDSDPKGDDEPPAETDDVVDPTGLSEGSTSERSADESGLSRVDDGSDGSSAEGGLTRVDDSGDEGEPPAPEAPGGEPPANRTRSGRPEAEAEAVRHEGRLGSPGGEPEPGVLEPDEESATDEPEIIGPRPPEEAEPLVNEPAEKYAPENIDEYWDDFDDIEDYGPDGIVEDPLEEDLLEEEDPLEPAIEEPDAGGVLERDRDGPPDDQEMPLTEHVEEMVWRLGFVVVTAAIVTILAYPFSEGLVLHIWSAVLPTADAPAPHLYGPLEKILTQIKVAGLAGILIALPLIVYQTYRFMRPGLYPHERRYYLAAVPTSLVLAAAGMAFSYFFLLPTLFVYFMYYTEDSVDLVAFGLSKTFNLIVTLTGVLAVVFQIPLFIMLAIMMGVTSRRWLASKRIYFWAAFAGVSFLIAPDPTGMAPFFVAGTAIGLFEGTLFLLKWVKRGRRRYRRSREEGA